MESSGSDIRPSGSSDDDPLNSLQPTKKLLDFYRKKLNEYEEDHAQLFATLNEFQTTYETQNKLEKDLQGRDEELATLRKALSDLQSCLLNEREHVLRLYADNDRLKIREVEDRRKIQHLLYLCGRQFPNADLGGFITEESDVQPTSRVPQKKKPATNVAGKDKRPFKPIFSEDAGLHPLAFQVEALRAQIEDQSRLSREQISALSEDCRLTQEEAKAQRLRDAEKINMLREQLKCSQDLLHKITKEHLVFQQLHRKQEQAWLAQRDRLALKLDSLKKAVQKHQLQKHSFSSPSLHRSVSAQVQATSSFEAPPVLSRKPSSVPSYTSKAELQNLRKELEQAKHQTEHYRNQCVRLEEASSLLREERDAAKKLYNDRNEALLSRLKLVKSRYSDLEKRFKVQMEGYRNDIKMLRTQLQTLERQCLKAALRMTEGDADILMLQQVHHNTAQSKLIFDNLKSLKSELYMLEEDLKHF